jgi:DNA-binding XRE family transcriptional regulator
VEEPVTQQLQLPPAVMKVVLGNELARLRNAAEATQEDAAGVLGCTQQKIAHVEAGSGAKLIELNALLEFYGAAEADRTYARNLQAESNRRTKRHAFSTRFPQYLRLLVDMESSCRRYFSYQALIVPGLLQAEDYMRTNARGWRPSLAPEQIEKDTENRLGRQKVLDNLNQQFWFVIDEAALRRTDGSPGMKAQIMHLVETIDRPNVELQVVPFNVGYYMGLGHDYTVFGYDTKPSVDIIYLEQHDGGGYIDNSERTARYLKLWEHQKAAANGLEQTRRALLDIAASM